MTREFCHVCECLLGRVCFVFVPGCFAGVCDWCGGCCMLVWRVFAVMLTVALLVISLDVLGVFS